MTQNGDAALLGRKSMAADVAAGEAAKTQKRAQKKARKDGVADTGKSASCMDIETDMSSLRHMSVLTVLKSFVSHPE